MDFDDISYDAHADLLYELAGQTVAHFLGYLSEDDTRKVLRCYQRDIVNFVHAQMQAHYWEENEGTEVKISKGFTDLKPSAYSAAAGEPPLDFRVPPTDKSNMAKYLFGGFTKCLYTVQKFQSDSERKLAVILEREATKWFKPAKGQFQIYYKSGADHLEYQPDFVAETANVIYMLEPKARNELTDPNVLAKKGRSRPVVRARQRLRENLWWQCAQHNDPGEGTLPLHHATISGSAAGSIGSELTSKKNPTCSAVMSLVQVE